MCCKRPSFSFQKVTFYVPKGYVSACKRLHDCILLIFSNLQVLKCDLLNICILYDLPFNKLLSALNIYTFDRLT